MTGTRARHRYIVLYWSSAAVVAAAGIFIPLIAGHKVDALPLYQGPVFFRPDRAYALTKTLATRFPDRVDGTERRREAARWIMDELAGLGYEVQVQEFAEVIASTNITDLQNIYALRPGGKRAREILAVVAHYDIPRVTHQGAMDDASGVGVVLELARVFAGEMPHRSLLFLLTDSEEYGALWGAKVFAEASPVRNRIAVALSLDHINIGAIRAIRLVCQGTKTGYTELWLRRLSAAAILHEGVKAIDASPWQEYLERAVPIAPSDHGAFLRAGINSLNFYAQGSDFAEQRRIHHTPQDVIENLRPESFGPYGRAVERLLRSLDSLAVIPKTDMSYLPGRNDRYLPGAWVTVLQWMAFLPSFLNVAHIFSRHGAFSGGGKELGMFLTLLLAGIIGYLILLSLPELGLMIKYELYPATQKEPILYHPQWLPLLLTYGAIPPAVMILRRLFFRSRPERRGREEGGVPMRAVLLALVVIAALWQNPHTATLFLLPAAYLWPRLAIGKGNWLGQLLYFLAGCVSLVGISILFSAFFAIGWMLWWLTMAAAYGLFSPVTVITALAAFALAGCYCPLLSGSRSRDRGSEDYST